MQLSFSKDGQWVAYVSYPEGTLWKSKLDGSQRLQLSYPPLYAMLPSWSPDGKQIVFFDVFARPEGEIVYGFDRWRNAARNDTRRPPGPMGPQLVARRNKNCLRRRFR